MDTFNKSGKWSGKTIVQHGKYQGKTFEEVATQNSDYIEFLREKGMRTEFKMLVKYFDILREFDS